MDNALVGLSMGIRVIFLGLGLFILCMSLHIIIWRIQVPRCSSLVLVVILIGVPAAGIAVLLTGIGGLRDLVPLGAAELLEIFLLHFSFSSAYIATYPAVRAVSPTLDILLMIRSADGGRMAREEIVSRYSNLRLVDSRIDDLMEYRFISENDGRFTVQPLARVLLSVFIVYRGLLGLPMGRG